MTVRYLEILETNKSISRATIFLKGKKEDLEELPLTLEKSENYKSAEISSYVETFSLDENARLLLAEHLTFNGWTCEASDFSSSTSSYGEGLISEKNYRDLWKK